MKRIITAVAVLVSLAAGSYAMAASAVAAPSQKAQNCAGPCSGCGARAPQGLTEHEYLTP